MSRSSAAWQLPQVMEHRDPVMTAHLPGRQPGSDLAPAIPSEPDGSSRDEGVLMAIHLKMPAEEAADRLAIRELFDAYAHCADRRDAQGQMALFTADTRFLVYMDSHSEQPTQELHGRESLAPVFQNLNIYQVTTHFNGQSTVVLDGDRATGESYCIAHHLYEADGQRTLMIASIRYLDQFARQSDGSWLFAERKLMVDWTETRPSNA